MADCKNGCDLQGNRSHDVGGIDTIVENINKNIEVESEEIIICKKAIEDNSIYTYEGSHKQILNKMNKRYGKPLKVITNKDNVITVETGQVVINKRAVNSNVKKRYTGTNREILDKINTSTGGRSIMKHGGFVDSVLQNGGIILNGETKLQSLLLSKSNFKTKQEADNWVLTHGFISEVSDETDKYYRYRVNDAKDFKKFSFRTIILKNSGVKAIVGIYKDVNDKGSNITKKSIKNEIKTREKQIEHELKINKGVLDDKIKLQKAIDSDKKLKELKGMLVEKMEKGGTVDMDSLIESYTENLNNAILKLGYFTKINKSNTSFGKSNYIMVDKKIDDFGTLEHPLEGLSKIRISDHSVSSFDRIFNQIHILPKDMDSYHFVEKNILNQLKFQLDREKYFEARKGSRTESNRFETKEFRPETDTIISERLTKKGETIYSLDRKKTIQTIDFYDKSTDKLYKQVDRFYTPKPLFGMASETIDLYKKYRLIEQYKKGGEIKDKTEEKSKQFMMDFINWYKKDVHEKMNIFVSINKSKDCVYLDMFEKIDQNADAKPYLQYLCDLADKYNVDIRLEPVPRYKFFLKNTEKRKKITKDYLIEYYKKFGFMEEGSEMIRETKMNNFVRTFYSDIESKYPIEIKKQYDTFSMFGQYGHFEFLIPSDKMEGEILMYFKVLTNRSMTDFINTKGDVIVTPAIKCYIDKDYNITFDYSELDKYLVGYGVEEFKDGGEVEDKNDNKIKIGGVILYANNTDLRLLGVQELIKKQQYKVSQYKVVNIYEKNGYNRIEIVNVKGKKIIRDKYFDNEFKEIVILSEIYMNNWVGFKNKNQSKEILEGGLSDNKTILDVSKKHNVSLDFANEQFEKGVAVEMEHTDNRDIASEIALDHLSESINYYIELEKMEDKLKDDTLIKNDKKYVWNYSQSEIMKNITNSEIDNFVENSKWTKYVGGGGVYYNVPKRNNDDYFVKIEITPPIKRTFGSNKKYRLTAFLVDTNTFSNQKQLYWNDFDSQKEAKKYAALIYYFEMGVYHIFELDEEKQKEEYRFTDEVKDILAKDVKVSDVIVADNHNAGSVVSVKPYTKQDGTKMIEFTFPENSIYLPTMWQTKLLVKADKVLRVRKYGMGLSQNMLKPINEYVDFADKNNIRIVADVPDDKVEYYKSLGFKIKEI